MWTNIKISEASDHDKNDTRYECKKNRKKIMNLTNFSIFFSYRANFQNANDIPHAATIESAIAKCDNNFY